MHFSADVKEKRERLLAAADWAGRCVSVACVHGCVRVCVRVCVCMLWKFVHIPLMSGYPLLYLFHDRQRLYYG